MIGTNKKATIRKSYSLLLPLASVAAFIAAFICMFTPRTALWNILMALPLYGLMLMLVRQYHVAALLSSLAAFGLYYGDQLMYSLRMAHPALSDMRLIDQAARVANRFQPIWNVDLTWKLALVIGLFLCLLLMMRRLGLKNEKKPALFAGLALFLVPTLVAVSGVIPVVGEGIGFSPEAEGRGLLYGWYCQWRQGDLKAPEGYSKEKAEAVLAGHTGTDGAGDVNVIAIMNESLTDYAQIGETVFDDPLPTIHSLGKNSFEGRLVVSMFGGGTSNTEYEFLTGNAMAFLPEGCTPYLECVSDAEASIVSDMGALGYEKIAIHPYHPEEWNREAVFQALAFDTFISGADFGGAIEIVGNQTPTEQIGNLARYNDEGPLYARGMISDRSCMERVLQAVGERSFIFAVTMQNHGGYDYTGADFINTEYVTAGDRLKWSGQRAPHDFVSVNSELYKVNQYLTCASLSDAAFGELLQTLAASEQKTIVLMFGDHQPGALISEHYTDMNGVDDPDYTVPYILWANFDIEFDAPERISPNYLSAVLKKNAGLPLTAWDQFRLETMARYPVITTKCILDNAGDPVDSIEALRDYQAVQYMRMRLFE